MADKVLESNRHAHVVIDQGNERFYFVEENRAVGDVYYVRFDDRCHWRESSHHAGGVAEAPINGGEYYVDYPVGGTAFRTEREALEAAVEYSEQGLQRLIERRVSHDQELAALRARLRKVS